MMRRNETDYIEINKKQIAKYPFEKNHKAEATVDT
jgi:hypothetical protein